MRKIGALYPLWNQELFIKPHLDMIKAGGIDRILVLMQGGPLPSYHREHGYSRKKDRTEAIIRKYHPDVEIRQSYFPWETMEFGAELYNEGLDLMTDCDVVFRLDPDMFWSYAEFMSICDFIRETAYECYRMDFFNDSINYFMTGDFDHGLKDAQEFDPLAVWPGRHFLPILRYDSDSEIVIPNPARPSDPTCPRWTCHHFRGWNKPRSTPRGWESRIKPEVLELYGDRGEFWKVPEPVRSTLQIWLDELATLDL